MADRSPISFVTCGMQGSSQCALVAIGETGLAHDTASRGNDWQ
jgi:hypothetical protein